MLNTSILSINIHSKKPLTFGRAKSPSCLNQPIKKYSNIAWSFDGGGAKGVYQIGVANALTKAGMIPRVIVGTSVGSINAAICANGELDKATDLWKNISKNKVYSYKVSTIAKKIWQKKLTAMLDTTPLRSFINKNLNIEPIFNKKNPYRAELMIGATDVHSGNQGLFATPGLYEKLKPLYRNEPYSELFPLTKNNIVSTIAASCSIPVAFPPVKIGDRTYVDGTGNCCPAKNGVNALLAMNQDAKEALLFVVLLSSENIKNDNQPEELKLLKLANQTLGRGLEKISRMDVERAEFYNKTIQEWDVTKLVTNSSLDDARNSINKIKTRVNEALEALKKVPGSVDTRELKRMLEDIEEFGQENLANTERAQDFIKDYKPLRGMQKIKIVVIRPKEHFGIEKLDFNKVKPKANEIIHIAYNQTLKQLYIEGLINKLTCLKLIDEGPTSIPNIYKQHGERINKIA